MIPTSKVLWGEGLFLRPQHFQRQDAYHEWRLAEAMRALHPYAWGLRGVGVELGALQGGVLRLTELSLIFPDGEPFSAPGEDDLPPAVSLADGPAQPGERVFHAALVPLRPNGANAALDAASGDDGSMRYARGAAPAFDLFTQAASAEVSTLRRSVRLVADDAPRDHLVSAPVCRVRRNASGGFELDRSFIPPAVSLQAAPALQVLLRRLLDVLQAKVDALYGLHREPSKNIVEFRSGDVASFWLLHTASSACAALMHYRQHPGLHPERLYERMLELAGGLMTFSKGHTLADLPAYSHAAPGPAFTRLARTIWELLETVISSRYFAIALTRARPSFYVGQLQGDGFGEGSALYLGVEASLAAQALIDTAPRKLKVGAPDDVDKAVQTAMAGVRIAHAAQVPAAIPVRPGMAYFAVEPRGPLYERMLQARTISIYAPQDLPDLKLELYAVHP